MRIFKFIFRSSNESNNILGDVAKVESIIASFDEDREYDWTELKAIDEKKLPKRREKIRMVLLNEIITAVKVNSITPEVRRLADCYLHLARFQTGVDAAHRELKRIFDPSSPTFVEWRGISPAVDGIKKKEADMRRDMDKFRLDLTQAGFPFS
jgi:hypothetical protein